MDSFTTGISSKTQSTSSTPRMGLIRYSCEIQESTGLTRSLLPRMDISTSQTISWHSVRQSTPEQTQDSVLFHC
ncbi:hypothetical protein CNYM01_00700 [Colletotrichum nymphaeae SA-01]|uniref:Uncharacterized protein n=1 Tax=Colletotrichum nymphaeae SA-01 TaxID=1460502 RepID=A0A135TEH1_9PEZI|nr:hypothetical protein CNYM01_00700 [Colletotrichum nymphaeae SA-01]